MSVGHQPTQPGVIRRFAGFEADVGAQELRFQGRRRPLQSQPFQVLLLLLERPGTVITREEIRQRIWPDGTFVDFDHGLNAAINKLRFALHDSARSPRFIETLAKSGYRFLAPVENVASGSPPPPAPLGAAPPRVLPVALFLAIQAMFLFLYFEVLLHLTASTQAFAALSGTGFAATWLPAAAALAGIPVRLYLIAAALLRPAGMQERFRVLFPVLFVLDEVWAAAPLLAQNVLGVGLALGFCALLVLIPFAQRTLVRLGALAA